MARTSAISDEVWASAIRAVMVDKMSLRTAAQKYGVHHMSLHRRIKDLRGDNKPEKAKAAQNAYLGSGSMMGMMNMTYPSMQSMPKPAYSPAPMRPVGHLPTNAPMMISPIMYSQEMPPAKASPKRNSPVQLAANWSKALQAVENGHLNVMQAASTFALDPASLHDHIKKRAEDMATVNPIEYLNLLDEYGIVKVLVARAELGVLMSIEELAELIQRTMYKQGQSCHGDTLQKIMYTFEVRNEHIMRTTVGNYHSQQHLTPPMRQSEPLQHHQQQQQQQSTPQHYHQQQSSQHYHQQSLHHHQQHIQQPTQQSSQLLQAPVHHPKQTIQQLQQQYQQQQQQIQQQQQQYMHQRSVNPTSISDGSSNDMMMRPNYIDTKVESKPEPRQLSSPSPLVPNKSPESSPTSKQEESSPSVQENSNKSGNRPTKSLDVVEI